MRESPSPGLTPALAANTTVFTLGIQVLLKVRPAKYCSPCHRHAH